MRRLTVLKIINMNKTYKTKADIEITKEEAEKAMKFYENPEVSHSLGWESSLVQEKVTREYFVADDEYLASSTFGFKTREERNLHDSKQKAIFKIHKYMRENNMFWDIDWNTFKGKWLIQGWNYGWDIPSLCCYSQQDSSSHNLIFKTEEDRDEILDKFPEELELILKG